MHGLEVLIVAGIVDEVGKSIVRVGKLGVGREPLVEP